MNNNEILQLSKSFALIWLELLHESNYLPANSFESIYDDNEKIRARLIKIIKSLKIKKTTEK